MHANTLCSCIFVGIPTITFEINTILYFDQSFQIKWASLFIELYGRGTLRNGLIKPVGRIHFFHWKIVDLGSKAISGKITALYGETCSIEMRIYLRNKSCHLTENQEKVNWQLGNRSGKSWVVREFWRVWRVNGGMSCSVGLTVIG